MSLLASDANSPDFVGAVDPDSKLFVEFFTWEKKDKIGEDGRKLTNDEGQPFVRIMAPGTGQLTVVEQKVREDHKQRFPRQWLAFQMQNGQGPVIGTPLEAWYEARKDIDLNEQQLIELRFVKFQSCEQLAGASDAQIQRLGTGGVGLRQRCLEWVRARGVSESRNELDELRERDKDRARELDEMRAMLAEALSRTPKKPGRKPKGVNRGQHAPATGDASHL